jgi:RNA polymerase sigma-70 factor (ECF subfamily)
MYRRFGHLMFGTCLNYLKNQQDAEDCVMEIFEDLPQKLQKFEVSHLKSWLFMTTKNACLMRLRKKKMLTSSLEEELTAVIEEDHEKTILEVKLEALELAISDLTEEQQRTIKLFYLDKKSYQEISDELQLPLKKVKSAIQNGKRNLKLKLENHDSFKSA